tara:strand:- start:2370 stop:3122 length:753 start_codon:yes stop_codon:yes gene_type:complete
LKKIVLVSGGFDPLHSGHIQYFKSARELGDELYVAINSDKWLTRKKGQAFMSFAERKSIIENLEMVNEVISFNDEDDTATQAIKQVKERNPKARIIFANGGDRKKENVPELNAEGVEFVFGVGGEHKINSSSTILENWKQPKVQRKWGWYRVLQDRPGYKIKELVINPESKLSMQRHKHRSENWYVLKGKVIIKTEYNNFTQEFEFTENKSYTIGQMVWHQGINPTQQYTHILEVQYGDKCIEEDIERRT